MMKRERGYETLRRHRWSQRGEIYFLTLCTADRVLGLTAEVTVSALRAELLACAEAGHWRVLGAVVMPDHLHLLAALIGDLPLGRIVARFKAKTRVILSAAGLRWQGNFYEHRLRNDDSVEQVLRCLFLNPYRAGLVAVEEMYPWFWLHPTVAAWFRPLLHEDRPFPEWLR